MWGHRVLRIGAIDVKKWMKLVAMQQNSATLIYDFKKGTLKIAWSFKTSTVRKIVKNREKSSQQNKKLLLNQINQCFF